MVSFQRALALFAAMGAVQMDINSLLLHSADSYRFHGDVTIILAVSRDVIHFYWCNFRFSRDSSVIYGVNPNLDSALSSADLFGGKAPVGALIGLLGRIC